MNNKFINNFQNGIYKKNELNFHKCYKLNNNDILLLNYSNGLNYSNELKISLINNGAHNISNDNNNNNNIIIKNIRTTDAALSYCNHYIYAIIKYNNEHIAKLVKINLENGEIVQSVAVKNETTKSIIALDGAIILIRTSIMSNDEVIQKEIEHEARLKREKEEREAKPIGKKGFGFGRKIFRGSKNRNKECELELIDCDSFDLLRRWNLQEDLKAINNEFKCNYPDSRPEAMIGDKNLVAMAFRNEYGVVCYDVSNKFATLLWHQEKYFEIPYSLCFTKNYLIRTCGAFSKVLTRYNKYTGEINGFLGHTCDEKNISIENDDNINKYVGGKEEVTQCIHYLHDDIIARATSLGHITITDCETKCNVILKPFQFPFKHISKFHGGDQSRRPWSVSDFYLDVDNGQLFVEKLHFDFIANDAELYIEDIEESDDDTEPGSYHFAPRKYENFGMDPNDDGVDVEFVITPKCFGSMWDELENAWKAFPEEEKQKWQTYAEGRWSYVGEDNDERRRQPLEGGLTDRQRRLMLARLGYNKLLELGFTLTDQLIDNNELYKFD